MAPRVLLFSHLLVTRVLCESIGVLPSGGLSLDWLLHRKLHGLFCGVAAAAPRLVFCWTARLKSPPVVWAGLLVSH